ncbi:hypothetical protein INT48_008655, partial [Thamnidium elegans]
MQYFAALQHRNSYTSEISWFGLEDDPNNVNKARIKSHADNVTEPMDLKHFCHILVMVS